MKNIKKLFFLFALFFAETALAQHQNHGKIETTKAETPNLGIVDEGVKKQLNELLLAYFQLKDELVAGRRDNANTKGKLFLETLAKVDTKKMTAAQAQFFTTHQQKLAYNAQNIADNEEVDAQRAFFSRLSADMKAVIMGFKANSQKVYVQHCPMAFDNSGASWLSAENKILNPYYGDRMLKCGTIVAEF